MQDRDNCPETWLVHENYMRWFSQMDYLEKAMVMREYTKEDIYYGAGPYPQRGKGHHWTVGSVWTLDYRCSNCGDRCGGRCGARSRLLLRGSKSGDARKEERQA